MTLNEALAIRINELLEEQQMTQYALFKASGVSPQEIDHIRRQRNNMNSFNIIFQLAHGFGMELSEFIDTPLFLYKNITD